MSAWHKAVVEKLRACGLFSETILLGAKVRAILNETRFLDVYFDPTTRSYSYALIDLGLPYPGDKRLFGWDDYPHENIEAIRQLGSYPHHFQRRRQDGSWAFEVSPMRGNLEQEIDLVISTIRTYLGQLG
jgi:hypothetical protein